MSNVDDQPTADIERQLADYVAWLDAELGPVSAPPGDPEVAPRQTSSGWSGARRWWLAAAAVVLALVAGLALVVGRDGRDDQVPASPTGDLRDVSGWFELDLPDVEVVESFTTTSVGSPAAPSEAYFVWADLDGDPIRSLSAYFPDDGVPTDFDDDVDAPVAVPDPPDGEAWVIDDPAKGAGALRMQWTRSDGTVVLTAGSGIDAATLARWTFEVGTDAIAPAAPFGSDLELVLDGSEVRPGAQYRESWVVDGADLSAWVSTDAPEVWFGLGYPTVDRISVAGREGYRFGGGRSVLVTFPLRNGYWGNLSMPVARADELVERVVIVDDSLPTPDEVTVSSVDVGSVDLATEWERVVADELLLLDPALAVDLTSAGESFPIGAVAFVPIEAGGRLVVDLRIWPTGLYDDPADWFEAVGVTQFGTASPEGAVFAATDGDRPRVGVVTELGVVELAIELPTELVPLPPWARFDDPDALDDAVGLARRLTARLPEVLAATGVDRDAGTVCAHDDCGDGRTLVRIEIPSIGVDRYVVASGRADFLADGPGLFPGNVPIASPDVVRIWGHRTAYGAPFLDLDQLEPGDQVVLTTPADARFVYVVESSDVVEPGSAVPASPDPLLVLSTPHPVYTTRQELRVSARICSGCGLGVPLVSIVPVPDR